MKNKNIASKSKHVVPATVIEVCFGRKAARDFTVIANPQFVDNDLLISRLGKDGYFTKDLKVSLADIERSLPVHGHKREVVEQDNRVTYVNHFCVQSASTHVQGYCSVDYDLIFNSDSKTLNFKISPGLAYVLPQFRGSGMLQALAYAVGNHAEMALSKSLESLPNGWSLETSFACPYLSDKTKGVVRHVYQRVEAKLTHLNVKRENVGALSFCK